MIGFLSALKQASVRFHSNRFDRNGCYSTSFRSVFPQSSIFALILCLSTPFDWPEAGIWAALPVAPDHDPIRIGMSADEVRAKLGPPKRIARQVLYRYYVEMWSYDDPAPIWFEFYCRKGQQPRLITVHSGPAL